MRMPTLANLRGFAQRHRWKFAGVLGVWVLWLLFGRFLLPMIVAPRIERGITEATGHPTTLGLMEFDPLRLAVTLHDLRIATLRDETVVSVQRLHVDFATRSLIDRAWNFEALELDQPFINATLRKDGSLNLADLAGPPSDDPPPPPGPGAAALPRVVVQTFVLAGGEIALTNEGMAPAMRTRLPNLALSLTDFSTLPDERGEYALQMRGPAGGMFMWRGSVGVNPIASQGRFTLEGAPIPGWFEILGTQLAWTGRSGSMRAQIDYSLAQEANRLVFLVTDGELHVESAAFGPREGEPIVTLPALDVTGLKLDLPRRTVRVGEVKLDRLGVTLAQDADGIDLIKLLNAPPPAPPVDENAVASAPATAAAAPATIAAAGSAHSSAASASATAPDAAPTAEPAAAQPPAQPWRVVLDRVALTAANIAFTDRTLPEPGTVTVAPLDLAVTDVALGPETRFTVALDAVVNGAGKVSLSGPLTGADPAGTLALKIEGLALAPFQPWVSPVARVELMSGALGVDAAIVLTPTTSAALPQPSSPSTPAARTAAKPGVTGKKGAPRPAPPRASAPAQQLKGYAEVTGLRVRDARHRQDLLRWKRLQLKGLDVALAPQRIRIEEIVAEQPYLRFLIGADGTTNLQGLMVDAGVPPPAAAKPDAAAATPVAIPVRPAPPAARAADAPLPLEIKRVRVLDGSANFADQSLKPVFATGIQQLEGSIVGLSSQEAKRAEITLDGKVDRYAPVMIRGKVNLFAAETYSDVTMSFHDIELTTFTPYAGKFAGYKIDKGRLSLDIRYQLEDRYIKGQHKVVLDQLTLGERVDSADALSLPIKLALALLKDSRGVIDLDLPVEGSLDDPQFKVGPLVWKAVVSLFTKIVTAPFAALGSLFGGGEDLSKLGFAAGSATLDPSAIARLDTLAKGLAERPALRLDVRGAAAPGADGALLARRRVLDAVRPDGTADELIALTPKELKALLAIHAQRFGADPTVTGLAEGQKATPEQVHEAALAALAAADGPTPEALRALAQARAAAVKDYLVTRATVPAERVFLLEADTTLGAAVGEPIELTLALSAE